ncbi:hypothetical protein PY093_14845 [Cytobacillus sp. S13-E01]|uniref:hypothetical protein n=1 Tax=Cytobacillus sp. S13-E01 TaxID=3031326 RepID=UPI0023D88491|nr:hypothetical protein [Cytobacillus sp. S13-E01]MDF0727953.1 hypothetical protein [Cytobacillus sp. S13-E01]
MKKKWQLSLIILLLGLAACADLDTQSFKNMKTDDLHVNQTTAISAEEQIKQMKEVTEVVAINNEKQLLLAFRVKQFEKFRLNKVEKKVKDELKKAYSDYEPTVSSDLKIFLETNKIKKDIFNRNLKKEKVEEELERVKKLSEEQT